MEILKLDIEKTEPDAVPESDVRFQVALLAGVATLVAALIARFAAGAPLVSEMMAQFIFAIAPIWMVEIAIGMLGPFAKHLAFLGCTVIYLGLIVIASVACLRYIAHKTSLQSKRLIIAAFAIAMWAMTMLVIFPLLGGGLLGIRTQQGAVYSSLSQFIIYAVYGVALAFVSSLYIDRPEIAQRNSRLLERRRVVRAIGYSVLIVGAFDMGWSLLKSWLQKGSGRVSGGNGIFPHINGLALEVTPNTDFFEVSKNPFDPQVAATGWKLEIGGMVENPLSFTFDEIKSLPSVEEYATLACISNHVGGDLIGNALWRGVRLKDLLAQAGLKAGVVDIVMTAADDYRDSISIDRALQDGTILVYEMNGEQLTPSHGFPVRLIVPGIYGMKNVKWIKRIEAVDYDFKGYWQRRGWDDRAEYQTMSRIDAPESDISGTTQLAGIAFAGDRRISKVEVSTDGGKTWEEAEIKEPLSSNTWVLWHKQWTPSSKGDHVVVVRATDGIGVTQTSRYARPDPAGSTGYHRVTIEAE
jgi:DMSO/TMAO reductase YedYZ molybdopterin-dependent catalytic subunit